MLGSPSRPPQGPRAVPAACAMPPAPSLLANLRPLLPGIALWALAFYLPLSLPLARLEEALAAGPLNEGTQLLLLLLSSLLLALAAGLLAEIALGWALGPAWASSLALVAALWGLFWALAGRAG
jgi:hypothetical protein